MGRPVDSPTVRFQAEPVECGPAANRRVAESGTGHQGGPILALRTRLADASRAARAVDVGCRLRIPPCSTFKIPNSLIGLDAGVISGADRVMKCRGSRRRRDGSNGAADLSWNSGRAGRIAGRRSAHNKSPRYTRTTASNGHVARAPNLSPRHEREEPLEFHDSPPSGRCVVPPRDRPPPLAVA